jgi:hypothetical protein
MQAAAWVSYFAEHFPELQVVHFASSPKFTRVRGARVRVLKTDPLGLGSAKRLLEAISTCMVRKSSGRVLAEQYTHGAYEAIQALCAVDDGTTDIELTATADNESDVEIEVDEVQEGEVELQSVEQEGKHDDTAAVKVRDAVVSSHTDDTHIVVGLLGDPNGAYYTHIKHITYKHYHLRSTAVTTISKFICQYGNYYK